jgi:predicted nucleic acid-binding protein
MIVVDTTVWIDYFNGRATPQTDYLDDLLLRQPILVGDLILGEILQGFQKDADFEVARTALGKLPQAQMLDPDLAVQSARNYRALRAKGVTVRKTIDCFIATFCIVNAHELLHNDRGFDPFETHLGLQVVHP